MRKVLLALSLTVASFSVFAAPSVKVSSFRYINQERKAAEICGTVSDMTTTPTFIRLAVDYTSKYPATYNTLADSNGKFCVAVISYYGTVEATTF